MIQTLNNTWALLLGIFMLMIGNGIQGTALGLRGEIESFSLTQMSLVMSAYFLGFMGGSWQAPKMIRRVGHVRVFAALASTISAVLILYPVLVDPNAWMLGRVVIGFCFAGVYVTAESWLNNAAHNEGRGAALSIYVVVQMGGIVLAQYLVSRADAGGFVLFIVPSVLVSLAFAPILLSVQPAPAFETSQPLALRDLIEASPLTSVGMLITGAVNAGQFTMVAVYGAQAGLSVAQISLLVSVIYMGALVSQFPTGWLSDRMDRRVLIAACAILSGISALVAIQVSHDFNALVIAAAIMGGLSNSLYALLLAYANDYIERDNMASASSGYLFVHGVGAICGPLLVGLLLTLLGPWSFWAQFGVLLIGLGVYALYRMTRRPASDTENVPFIHVAMGATNVAVEIVQEEYIAREIEAEEEGHEESSSTL